MYEFDDRSLRKEVSQMYEFDDRLETMLRQEDPEVQAEKPELLSHVRTSDNPDWEEVRMCARCGGECKIF